jgi:DNA-binding MarR family transcriptional regulator
MDDTSERFRQAYWAVVHNLDSLRLRTWEERGLTLPQLRVLFLMRAQPGTTTHALAARLGISTATVSGLVDKLVRAGLVERGQRADDRRVIPLCLTAEGHAAVGEIRRGNRAYLAELAEELGDDLAPVAAALERLAAAIGRRPASQEGEQGDA